MMNIEERIYDDITHKGNNFNQTFMSKNNWLRYLGFIINKIISVSKLWIVNKLYSPSIHDKNVCIVLTANQFRSVESLLSDDFIFLRPSLDSASLEKVQVFNLSPRKHLKDLWNSLSYIRHRSDLSWKMYYPAIAYFYYYAEFLRLFKEERPKSLTITNPTHPILRSAVFAARELNLPTVYLPHASPSPTYPPIPTDYALLEGNDGLSYYTFSSYTKKILTGSPRLDKYQSICPIPHEGINLLVAINLLDDIQKVKDMIKGIRTYKPFGDIIITLRPHPNQNISKKQAIDLGADYISDSKVETCLDALRKSDILIAGNTTTFFEAIYFPIVCFYYDFIKDEFNKDSYRLSTYKFITIFDPHKSYAIDKQNIDNKRELERIDYASFKNLQSTELIISFYKEFNKAYE